MADESAPFSLAPRELSDAVQGALGETLLRRPEDDPSVLPERLNRGAQWLIDAVRPFVPPELRGKIGALGEAANMVNPVSAHQGFIRAANEGNYGDAALNAFGLVPGEALAAGAAKLAPALFLGAGSRTADKAALAEARRLKREGASPDEIIDATRWEKRPDRQWRYEISDHDAAINADALSNTAYFRGGDGSRLGDVLAHPELYKAYPDLADLPVWRYPALNAFGENHGMRGGFIPEGTPGFKSGFIVNDSLSPEEARKTLLHEIQHAIQQREKFASGGAVGMPEVQRRGIAEFDSTMGRINTRNDEISREIGKWIRDKYGDVRRPFQPHQMEAWRRANPDLAKERDSIYDFIASPSEAERLATFSAYQKLQGEAEARNASARADLIPAQRFLLRPETTEKMETLLGNVPLPRSEQWVLKEKKPMASTPFGLAPPR